MGASPDPTIPVKPVSMADVFSALMSFETAAAERSCTSPREKRLPIRLDIAGRVNS